ncbi:MAG TPA: YbjQ family protein, partial [Pasteurellaceae bacterium]|nr:YbjQ family protein [Pasteurellaceae bacterium]
MTDRIVLLIQLMFLVGMILLLVAAFFAGSADEKKHYQSILAREEALNHIMVVPVKRLPEFFSTRELVLGSVVMSSNKFTRMLAAFRNIFGGKVHSYETLLDRARREAVLRMKEEAVKLGANMILNMKFETAALG